MPASRPDAELVAQRPSSAVPLPIGTCMDMEKAGPSFGSRIIAALVLAVAAYVLLKVIIGFAAAIAGTIVDHRGDRRGDLGAARPAVAALVPYLIIAFFFGLAGGVVGQDQGQLVRPVVPDQRRSCP